MNREMWLRILTVAVVAPYLFKQSGKETGYFAIGLKLTAGALIAMNIVPLMNDAKVLQAQVKTIVANLAKAQETLAAQNASKSIIDVTDFEEAEFVDKSA